MKKRIFQKEQQDDMVQTFLLFFQEKLFIEDKHIDNFSHPKYGKWKNNKTLDKSIFVSVSVHKTEKGLPTLFYKTTELGYKEL